MTSPAPSAGERTSPALQANNTVAGSKRKRPSEKKFYAVKSGKKPGVYNTWTECLDQVRGHKGADFKAFHSLPEAEDFVAGKFKPPLAAANPGEQKFYGVQRGTKPGVYLDWPSAQAQIRGCSGPRYKKFGSRAEAEAYVAAGKQHVGGMSGDSNLSSEEQIRQLNIKKSAPGLQMNGTYIPRDKNGEPYEIGTGPLPPGAEDGFDPNIRLGESGELVYKTEEEKARTKLVPREKDPPGMLRIYTDGSSLRNGTAGARAGVGVFFGPQDPKYDPSSSSSRTPPSSPAALQTQTVYTIDWAARGAASSMRGSRNDDEQDAAAAATKTKDDEAGPKLTNWRYRNVSEALKGSKQTNQRAELTAIQRALDIAPKHRDVTIYTDSRYSIDCVTNWYRGWEKNGWLNSKGKPVENLDLVKGVRSAIAERENMKRKTLFVWVKGHQGTHGNVEADRLANEGARLPRSASESASVSERDANGESEDRPPTVKEVDAERDTKVEDTKSGLPGANGTEEEDVKQAFEDMAASMEQDEKFGVHGFR